MEWLGNLASLVGCILMVSIGLIKNKKRVLVAQCAQFGFMGIGNLALGAVSGVIANILSVVRNLVFARVQGGLWLKLVFIGAQVALTLFTGLKAPVEWLPLLATVTFTWSLDMKSDVSFKLAIVAGQGLWMVYDLHYHNYVAFVFDMLTILSNFVGIFLIHRAKK